MWSYAEPLLPDTSPLPCCVTGGYSAQVSHNYSFKRGDPVTIVSGRYKGHTGVVDSVVFQETVDYPDDQHPGYHVVLEDERWLPYGGIRLRVTAWGRVRQIQGHDYPAARCFKP